MDDPAEIVTAIFSLAVGAVLLLVFGSILLTGEAIVPVDTITGLAAPFLILLITIFVILSVLQVINE